jgi:hypothetical protein
VFKDFKEAIYMAFDVPEYKLAINLVLFWLMFLQIPFKFFLEKEFLFILYDELKDLGVSESVDGIQRDLYAERGYNQSAIERVSTRDHYQVVRENYLKLSKREYMLITTGLYVFNMVLLVLLKTEYLPPDRGTSEDNDTTDIIVATSAVIGAFIQPLVVYVASGYFYYKVSI